MLEVELHHGIRVPPAASQVRTSFGPRRRLGGSEKGHEISFLLANSLRILTGNFLRPCRELNRAIREVSAVIRESRLPPQFGVRPLVTNPIIGAVGRVARARVQRAHRRWGDRGVETSPSGGETVANLTSSIRVDPGRMAPGPGGAPRWRLLGTR